MISTITYSCGHLVDELFRFDDNRQALRALFFLRYIAPGICFCLVFGWLSLLCNFAARLYSRVFCVCVSVSIAILLCVDNLYFNVFSLVCFPVQAGLWIVYCCAHLCARSHKTTLAQKSFAFDLNRKSQTAINMVCLRTILFYLARLS